jgi:hypothetical protein
MDLDPKDLNAEEKYYLAELSSYYKRAGYLLPDEEFARMTEIKREVCRLEIRFLIFI